MSIAIVSPALSPDGSLVAFANANGHVFIYPTGGNSTPILLFDVAADAGARVYSSLLFTSDGSTIILGTNGNKVIAITVATGTVAWTFATGLSVQSAPAIDSVGNIYIAT